MFSLRIQLHFMHLQNFFTGLIRCVKSPFPKLYAELSTLSTDLSTVVHNSTAWIPAPTKPRVAPTDITGIVNPKNRFQIWGSTGWQKARRKASLPAGVRICMDCPPAVLEFFPFQEIRQALGFHKFQHDLLCHRLWNDVFVADCNFFGGGIDVEHGRIPFRWLVCVSLYPR